jgi:uncharacterized membrane protein YkvA (DUF1232 family)
VHPEWDAGIFNSISVLNMSNNGTSSTREAGGNGYGATNPIKEKLERDAERVTEKDIENLNDTVPKKLRSKQLSDLKENFGWVREMVDHATTLFDMMRDRDYKISGKSKTMIAAGLLYLVLPTDLVPDFIPGIGFIDDALVLSTLWKVVQGQIENYLAFRQSNPSNS